LFSSYHFYALFVIFFYNLCESIIEVPGSNGNVNEVDKGYFELQILKFD